MLVVGNAVPPQSRSFRDASVLVERGRPALRDGRFGRFASISLCTSLHALRASAKSEARTSGRSRPTSAQRRLEHTEQVFRPDRALTPTEAVLARTSAELADSPQE